MSWRTVRPVCGKVQLKRVPVCARPELTEKQLAGARRVGRPLAGRAPKQLIAIRVDPDLLVALRKMAGRQKIGYQSLIQRLLRDAVRFPHIA